ncbi:hypothetical protein M3J09_007638 [Ascochyta lentis]
MLLRSRLSTTVAISRQTSDNVAILHAQPLTKSSRSLNQAPLLEPKESMCKASDH